MATIKEYWNTWLWRDAITKFITINVIMWIIVSAGLLFLPNGQMWISLFTLPTADKFFPSHFWTIITYMFVHIDFLHLMCNMLWLMLFGRLFVVTQSGMRLTVLYIYGGIAGAAAFLGCNALGITVHHGLLGASCSVLAIIGAVMVISPNWHVNLLFFGNVKVIWVVLVSILFFVLLAPSFDQFLAHLAGLLMGVIYALLRRHNIDIAMPMLRLLYYLRLGVDGELSARPNHDVRSRTDADELDELLAKISRSGYASLSPHERQRLFNLSRKIKR